MRVGAEDIAEIIRGNNIVLKDSPTNVFRSRPCAKYATPFVLADTVFKLWDANDMIFSYNDEKGKVVTQRFPPEVISVMIDIILPFGKLEPCEFYARYLSLRGICKGIETWLTRLYTDHTGLVCVWKWQRLYYAMRTPKNVIRTQFTKFVQVTFLSENDILDNFSKHDAELTYYSDGMIMYMDFISRIPDTRKTAPVNAKISMTWGQGKMSIWFNMNDFTLMVDPSFMSPGCHTQIQHGPNCSVHEYFKDNPDGLSAIQQAYQYYAIRKTTDWRIPWLRKTKDAPEPLLKIASDLKNIWPLLLATEPIETRKKEPIKIEIKEEKLEVKEEKPEIKRKRIPKPLSLPTEPLRRSKRVRRQAEIY